MCRLCGREACAECFSQVRELTTDRAGASEAEIAALQARREKHAHINPFFLSCTRRNEHRASDFSPMSRFSKDELDQAIVDMKALLEKALKEKQEEDDTAASALAAAPLQASSSATGAAANGASDSNVTNGVSNGTPNGASNGVPKDGSHENTSAEGLDDVANGAADPHIATTAPSISTPPKSSEKEAPTVASSESPTAGPPDPSTFATQSLPDQDAMGSPIPSHPVRRFVNGTLTDEIFREIWATGEPIVVTDLQSKFRIEWTPDYFRHKYGSQSCLILECQTDQNKRVTVGEFFSWFGKYEGRRDCWKLKVRATGITHTCLGRMFTCCRTGHHPQTSNPHSQSCTRTSVRLHLFLITYVETASTTSRHTSQATQ